MNQEDRTALLDWYRALGVDAILDERPRDWFASPAETELMEITGMERSPAVAPQPRVAPKPLATTETKPATRPVTPQRLVPPQEAEMAARELARKAASLTELEALAASFDGCGLKATASKLCFARGRHDAALMMIGEAPGRDEDMRGVPFVGRAGQLLDRMIAAIGLAPDDAYITNLVFWRPPGNRTPTPQEVQSCQPFVERQIELVRPKVLVFLGAAAAKQLTGASDGIMKLRGRWLGYGEGRTRAIATLHPAYLLRNPLAKRLAWRDLLKIRAALDGEAD